jgi:hypothetical protein
VHDLKFTRTHIYSIIIDNGNYKNVLFKEAVKQLLLKTNIHLKPNKLTWFKREGKVIVDNDV